MTDVEGPEATPTDELVEGQPTEGPPNATAPGSRESPGVHGPGDEQASEPSESPDADGPGDEQATEAEAEAEPDGTASRTRRGLRARLRSAGVKLGVAALSMAVTLGCVELAFRLVGYQPVYDVYSSPEEFFRSDPDLGWSLAPGSEGEFVGPRPFPIQFRSDVRVNSLGLRGPEITPVPTGGLRILVLGDSWVAGLEVAEDRTYSARLEDELTDRLGVPVQVINAGVRGYGTDQAWLFYRERLRRLDPDLVIHHTTGNDPDDNTVVHRMRRVFSKPAFVLEPDGGLDLVGQPVEHHEQCSELRVIDGEIRRVDGARARAFCFLQTRLSDHSAFFSFVTERLQGNPELVDRLYGLGAPTDASDDAPSRDESTATTAGPTTASTRAPDTDATTGSTAGPTVEPSPQPGTGAGLDYPHRLTSALVRELARDVRDDGGRFVLVGRDGDLGALDVAGLAGDRIPTVGIEAALTGQDEVLIPNDGHPNELGHERIAELLADELQPGLEELVR